MIIVPLSVSNNEAAEQFSFGLKQAKALNDQIPGFVALRDWACVASFARTKGSGTQAFTDVLTGSWVLTVGTWFHAEGAASGEESLLLRYYEQFGASRLARELEGFFTVVLGDSKKQEIVVITDVIGSCHCYVRAERDFVAISTSSLLLAALGPIHLDAVGCQEFLNTGIIYEQRTLYREVRKLQPAAVFRFSSGCNSHEVYWSVHELQPESIEGDGAVQRVWDTLRAAATRVGKKFSRPVCDLTGGYDSRAVVAAFLAARLSFSTVVSGAADSADVRVSTEVAEVFGLPHLHLSLSPYTNFTEAKQALFLTDGEYNLIEYANILRVHNPLSEQFGISINGSFGELARGYWWELLFPHTGKRVKLDAQRLAQRRFAAKPFDPSLFPPNSALDLVSHLAGVIERTNVGLEQSPNTLQMDHVYLMMRMQRWQGRIASSTNRLWPCLSPFMFRSVLEVILQTKASARQRSLLIRKMLAHFQPQLAEIPLEHGYPPMPVNWKTWYRFWPLALYYGERLWQRLATGHFKTAAPLNSAQPPARMQLWADREVLDILMPSRMRLGTLLEQARLQRYITASKERQFAWNEQWMRLLTLECTLRALETAGVTIVT